MLCETFLALGYFHHLKSHKIVKDILPHAGNSEKETFTCSNNWSVRLEKNSCLQRKLQPQGDDNVTTFQSKQWNELVLYIHVVTLFTAFSDTLSITSKHCTVNSRKWSTKKNHAFVWNTWLLLQIPKVFYLLQYWLFWSLCLK